MKLYAVEVTLHATAYVKADTPEAALALANNLPGDGMDIRDAIDGRPFECLVEDESPDITLSPAMTFAAGTFEDADEAYSPDESEPA